MNLSEIQKLKQEIVKKYGEWTAHSILLAPNVYTVVGKEYPSGRPQHYVKVVQDFLSPALEDIRVLDLGCLEGMYAFEFAKHGANVLGIDGRQANVEKARFANRVLNFQKCDFVQDDVRNLSSEKYGSFDVVLCCGILYHLDVPDVFLLMENIAKVCTGVVVIDTHVAVEQKGERQLSEQTFYDYKGVSYSGRYFTEFTNESMEQKLKSVWSALGNDRSFWLDRKSLYRAIKGAGFANIYEDLEPYVLAENNDRLTFVALK